MLAGTVRHPCDVIPVIPSGFLLVSVFSTLLFWYLTKMLIRHLLTENFTILMIIPINLKKKKKTMYFYCSLCMSIKR